MTISALVSWSENAHLLQTLTSLTNSPLVDKTAVSLPDATTALPAGVHPLTVSSLWSKPDILNALAWFLTTGSKYLLFITGTAAPTVDTNSLQRMTQCMDDTGAAMVYGDFFDVNPDGTTKLHQLIDYQLGSIRDTFDFGSVILCSGSIIATVYKEILASETAFLFGGWYDLRLRLSEKAAVYHLPEPLYSRVQDTGHDHHTAHFSYVDPKNRDYQIEMEQIATAHLQRIGALVTEPDSTPSIRNAPAPVVASIVIPVRNRHRTIRDAVESALSQKTTFTFNILVIDNHSNDGTTEILASIAKSDPRLLHIVPQRTDLLIGGCWNEAIYSPHCGTYAVQLDSDDIYDGTAVLERIVTEFKTTGCALVIGSYTTVDFDRKLLPPGLIDHKEWTSKNGMNNALRIAGLGAPRAYHVPTVRQFGFPNVSYGEDYAVVLRLSRSYRIGRIYDSLYWCRRWAENSDSQLAPETANRYDLFKDRLRSVEIAARMRKGCTNE